MAFSIHLSHLEYLVMPFVLAVFQALDNDVLHDYMNHSVFVYFDDSLIFSRNLSEHQTHSHNVLWKNKLYVKGEKCEFHVDSVSLPGFITQKGWSSKSPGSIGLVQTNNPEAPPAFPWLC